MVYPKGEILPDEDPLVRALTEFKEETGKAAEGQFIELSPIRQKEEKQFMHGPWKEILILQVFTAIAFH